jgi:DNA end-binding protein Ku
MARALWSGAITFGLVSIPVEVHTAVRDKQLRFHMLTAKDKSRVKFQRVSEKTGRPVDWDDLVKGYEYAKGRYVVLTPKDFEAAALEKTRTIDIMDFVKAEQVDDRFFDKPYYLTPGSGGERAYALLRETIRDAGRIGIAKFVLRDQLHLAALEVIEDALVLSTLRFADELVDTSEYKFPGKASLKAAELKMARMLVNELAADWKPEQYTDEYRQNLLRIIESKRTGEEPELDELSEAPTGKVVDLMERLRSSLEGSRGAKARGTKASGSKKPAADRVRKSAARRKTARKGSPRAA